MRHGDQHVIVTGVVLWDGITRPEIKEGGKQQFSLKIAITNNAPEMPELQAIATAALQADSKFKGQLPPGGCWPLLPVDPNDFEGKLPTHTAFNCKSNRLPQVFNATGQELNSMVYGNMLFAGAVVQVIVNAFSFDNKSKGVAFGLEGIKIVDTNAPRLPVGASVDVAAIFGGPPAAGAQLPPSNVPYTPNQVAGAPPAGVMPPGVQPAPSFLNPPPAAPVKQMTPQAQGTYEQYIGAGWTDAQLIAQGLLLP